VYLGSHPIPSKTQYAVRRQKYTRQTPKLKKKVPEEVKKERGSVELENRMDEKWKSYS
jgi:hypothetical protein